MKRGLFGIIIITVLVVGSVIPALADPLPGEVIKFYQLPLNNTFVPLPPGAVYTNGAPTQFPGHDELSTALFNGSFYQGTYMADDFCDYRSTPIVHVMWWGSYMSNYYNQVQQFLITFESDVSATNVLGYSHPGTNILSQIVNLGPLAPFSGTFTETPLPLGPGFQCDNNLYQYNAELAAPFPEQSNQVYWIKIVALTFDTQLRWGWHNRDYGLMDPLACTAATGVVPGEFDQDPGAAVNWHFQDDAVTGQIFAQPQSQTNVFVNQPNYIRTFYTPPCDGNFPSNSFSKDLAFALYTTSIPTNPCPPQTNPPTKFLQRPKVDQSIDLNGMNVYDVAPKVLGDDFLCSLTGPITDIHIWGSWLNDQIGIVTNFQIGIFSDIPATNDVYSRPGNLLWSTNFFFGQYTQQFYTNSNEYFFNPNINQIIGGDSQVFRYNFCIDSDKALIQTNGVIYWLVVQAFTLNTNTIFGWKSSTTTCYDNAVWGDTPGPIWQELRYPSGHGLSGQGFDLAFELTTPIPFYQWQIAYFGSTNCPSCGGGADFDGDGMINSNEYLAGTVPTNSASSLRFTTILRQGVGSNDVNLTWKTVGGHSYIVQTNSPPVANGSFTNNFSDLSLPIPIPGTGESTASYVDVGGGTNIPTRYYRVRLGPPVCE